MFLYKYKFVLSWQKGKKIHTLLPVQELLQLEDRLGSVNRGAVQTTIERFTFPHKYKKVETNKKKSPSPHRLPEWHVARCSHWAGAGRKDQRVEGGPPTLAIVQRSK